MTRIRRAGPGDAPEIVRLRRVMFAAMAGRDRPGDWERAAVEAARAQLSAAEPVLAGFVVDGDEGAGGPHLAACALGRVEDRLPTPGRPAGRCGFLFNVCTDPRYRGRGHARAVTEAALEWFAGLGVTRIDLHATEEAERMYRSMGFEEYSIALSLDLSRR